MAITHAKVSAVADDADASTVSPTDWNAVHVGAGTTIRLLGPFSFSFNTPNVNDVAKVADLDAGVTVVRTWVVTSTVWNSTSPYVAVGVGGSNWAPPNYDYTQTSAHVLNQVQAGVGWTGESPASAGQPERRVVRLSAAGALVVGVVQTGSPTTGSAVVYALIAE